MEIPKFDDESIHTKFSRPILKIAPASCVKVLPKDYTEYQLFSFRIWASPILKKYFGSEVEISYQSEIKYEKLYLTIVPMISSQEIKVSKKIIKKVQSEISGIETDNTLLIIIDSSIFLDNGNVISLLWIRQMLQFIKILIPIIDEDIDITSDIDYEISDNKIKLYLQDNADYYDIYVRVSMMVHRKLKELFSLGLIYKPSVEIVENWELESTDFNENIFQIGWQNAQLNFGYASKIDFIISRMHGVEYIDIILDSDDYTYRHLITVKLSQLGLGLFDFIFYVKKLRVKCNNLKLAREILYEINSVKITGKYLAKVLYLKNQEEIIINREFKNDKVSECYYQIKDFERPLIYSRLIEER